MSSVVRLHLIAHAHSEANRAVRFPTVDEPLTHIGERLVPVSEPSGRIVCAPELRAQRTAESLGWPSSIDDGVRDLDVGRWAGRALDDVDASAWLTDPEFTGHGGPSLQSELQRVRGWMNALDRAVTAVTHPFVVRLAVVIALGAPVSGVWRVDAGPLTEVRLHGRDGVWTLRSIGAFSPSALG